MHTAAVFLFEQSMSSLGLANEGCNDYHPMFFTHDRAWEEFFCVCIQLLNKTWKEMRATSEDFNKVWNQSAVADDSQHFLQISAFTQQHPFEGRSVYPSCLSLNLCRFSALKYEQKYYQVLLLQRPAVCDWSAQRCRTLKLFSFIQL